MLYPFKFRRVFKEKVWGGRDFEKVLHFTLPDNKNYGETWEISAHSDGPSRVQNGPLEGKFLEELMTTYKEKLVGEKVYQTYGDNFPLLVKFLDIHDHLSLQVHPNDEYAIEHEKELGKSEAWYVFHASSDAKILYGTKPNITKQTYLKTLQSEEHKEQILDLFEVHPIKAGDFINIPAGTPHASYEGSMLLVETQENSNSTYRIYDYERKVDGKLRPLHIDKSADVINFGQTVSISHEKDRILRDENKIKIETLLRSPHFNMDILHIGDSNYTDKLENSFCIYSILEGNGKLSDQNNEYYFNVGDTYLIPYELKEITIKGSAKICKSYLG